MPSERPQPQFGEYAPEGWEWKPPTDETELSGSPASPASSGSPVAGVPHNLGVSAASTAQQLTASAPLGDPPPYRADDPDTRRREQAAPSAAPSALPTSNPRRGDRIITTILLGLGGIGALNSSASFFAMESQLQLTATVLGIDSLTIPSWVNTLGLVSGLGTLLLYALTLLFSIQRLRAHKITFWVPLTAGAISVLLAVIIPLIALGGAPEIMHQLENDPNGSLELMMQYLENPQ